MGTNNQAMPRARNDESGEYTTVYRDDMFTDAVADGEQTTKQVADTVECSYQTAYQYLRRLADAGMIESRKVGNTRLWSLSSEDSNE